MIQGDANLPHFMILAFSIPLSFAYGLMNEKYLQDHLLTLCQVDV